MSPIGFPTLFASETIDDSGVIFAEITAYFTGSIQFSITANGNSGSPTWDNVTLVSGTAYEHNFSVGGSDVQYKIVGTSGSTFFASGGNTAVTIKLM